MFYFVLLKEQKFITELQTLHENNSILHKKIILLEETKFKLEGEISILQNHPQTKEDNSKSQDALEMKVCFTQDATENIERNNQMLSNDAINETDNGMKISKRMKISKELSTSQSVSGNEELMDINNQSSSVCHYSKSGDVEASRTKVHSTLTISKELPSSQSELMEMNNQLVRDSKSGDVEARRTTKVDTNLSTSTLLPTKDCNEPFTKCMQNNITRKANDGRFEGENTRNLVSKDVDLQNRMLDESVVVEKPGNNHKIVSEDNAGTQQEQPMNSTFNVNKENNSCEIDSATTIRTVDVDATESSESDFSLQKRKGDEHISDKHVEE